MIKLELNREFLQELREVALEASKKWGLSTPWKIAYESLALAADVLDAFWARSKELSS